MKFITWLRYLIFLISLSQSDAINKIFCDLLTSVPFPALAAVQLSILWVLIGCLTCISLVWLAVAVTLVFTPEWSFFIWEDALQNHFPCEVLILSSCDETNLDVGLHLSFFNKTEKNPGFHAFSTYACHFPTTDFSFWKLELESDGGKLVSSHVSGQVYVLVRGKKSRVSIISALFDTSCCRLTGNDSPHELFQLNPHWQGKKLTSLT